VNGIIENAGRYPEVSKDILLERYAFIQILAIKDTEKNRFINLRIWIVCDFSALN